MTRVFSGQFDPTVSVDIPDRQSIPLPPIDPPALFDSKKYL
jgi:hypothetical protein